MISRANTAASGACGTLYSSEANIAAPERLRRSKSMSSTLGQHLLHPNITRSDVLTEKERHMQARAAAARAFKNDLLRKGELGIAADGTPPRRPSVRFKPTPPSDLDFNPYSFLEDGYNGLNGSKLDLADCISPHRVYNPTHVPNAPSSYRRLRRSRSLFSISRTKSGYARSDAVTERSNSVNSKDLRPRRSMSFLRGGTDFMPLTYRKDHQPPVQDRKGLYTYETTSSGERHTQTGVIIQGKPRSLRMKVRRMSSSIINTFKRALFFSTGRVGEEEAEMPPQHVISNRPYFGDYDIASGSDKNPETPPQDMFISQVNSGAPTLRRVPSSIGYPSRSGSIRIVTPPKATGTPLSSSGNTWASSTTVSTLRSATGSKRLSIIRETTPKDECEGETKDSAHPRNKALDAQRVYSAFLRVTRAKTVNSTPDADTQTFNRMRYATLSEDASAQSCSSIASTVRKNAGSPKKSIQDSFVETPCPSPRHIIVSEQKENIPPTPEQKPASKTHVTIGPRITLYPPPAHDMTPGREEKGQIQTELALKTVRHSQSAFFPYTGGNTMVGNNPSPYKRATAMSPDAPSIYSRTTSGNTPPLPSLSLAQDQTGHASDLEGHLDEVVQHRRKVSLFQMNENRDGARVQRVTPSPSKNSLASYRTAKTRRDENIPVSTYLPGLMKPSDDMSTTDKVFMPHSAVAGAFGMNFFHRGRGRRDVGLGLVTRAGDGVGQGGMKTKHRVLTAKNIHETINVAQTEIRPLLENDSNLKVAGKVRESKNNWRMGTGTRLSSRSQAPTGINSGEKGKYKPKWDSIGADKSIIGNESAEVENKPGNTGTNIHTQGTGCDVLGQMSKFSFEVNDDKGYALSANQPLTLVESNIRNPKIFDGRRNVSVGSGTGAFL